jgi:Flp pilus assembly protein TadD
VDADPKRLIDVSNLYDEAVDRFREGDGEGALRVLRELVKRQPHSSQAHQELAYVLYQGRRLPEAIAVLENALRGGVQDASLLGLLGAYLLEAGDSARVVELLEDVVRRDPAYAEAHNYLGIAYTRLRRFEDAVREYETLLELDPSSASAHNNLGSLALTRGDARAAIAHFESALAFDPDHASTHNGLGVAYARGGNFERAIESWRRAVELDPRQYDALYNLAVALYDRSPREAAPYLEQFVRDAPSDRYRADIAKVRGMLAAASR